MNGTKETQLKIYLKNVLKEICARLRHADEKIETLAFLDVYGRTVRTLQQLAHDHGIKTKKGRKLALKEYTSRPFL